MIFDDIDFLEFVGVRDIPFKTPLNLAKLYEMLDFFKNDLHGLQSFLKKWRIGVSNEIEYNLSEPIVSGWTLTPGLNNRDYVNVKLIIHTSYSYDEYKFTKESWKNFKIFFVQVLAHEFIHFRQAHNSSKLEFKDRTLSFKKSTNDDIHYDREYHASVQEIEAYGHCLYLETLWFPCKYNDFKKRLTRTPTYVMLLKVFGGDHTCPVIKAHKSAAIKWKLKYEKAK